MVSEEFMQEEIDKATTAVSMCNDIERYAELQRIKYSSNRDEEIDRALHTREAILKVWGVNVDELKQVGEILKDKVHDAADVEDEGLTDEEIDRNLSISHVACLWDVRMKIKQQNDNLTKEEMLELIDEMASEILKK